MIERTVLDCGLVVISHSIPAFPSFALSYTLRGGSRGETKQNAGIFHMIEHMLFKGTGKYKLREIADISDRLGGKLNAMTGKEITQYYIKAVDEDLDDSFDLLSEMVFNSTFPADEFEKEKQVAIQEIYESEDNPDTHAFETFFEEVYKNNGLGYLVGGYVESVSAFNRDMVFDFYKNHYTPGNMVLAAVGNVPHEKLVELAAKHFKDYPPAKPSDFGFREPCFNLKTFSKKNDSLKQVYAVMGCEGMSIKSPNRYRYMIVNDILGAGMSSRLYQAIREEKGLAYTVNSFTDSYLDCGLHMIYSIMEPAKVNEYLDAVKEELLLLIKNGLTQEELERSRASIKSSIILGLESFNAMMRFHVNNELYLGRELNPHEIIDNMNSASLQDINNLITNHLAPDKMSVFLYGDVHEKK